MAGKEIASRQREGDIIGATDQFRKGVVAWIIGDWVIGGCRYHALLPQARRGVAVEEGDGHAVDTVECRFVLRAVFTCVEPDVVAQGRRSPDAKVDAGVGCCPRGIGRRLYTGDGRARGQHKGRAADETTAAPHTIVIQVGAVGGAIGAAADIAGRGLEAHHIGAADDPREGVVAIGIGCCRVDSSRRLVGGSDGQGHIQIRLVIVLAVVVQIRPDAVAQGQLVEAKVNRLVAVPIGAGLDRVVALVAFTRWLGGCRQADRLARHYATGLAQAVDRSTMIPVVAGRIDGIRVLTTAVHIAHEQPTRHEVGVADDDEIVGGQAAAWCEVGKGVVAATGQRAGDQGVTTAERATAIAVLVEFDHDTVSHILFTAVNRAIIVGVIPDAVAQADHGCGIEDVDLATGRLGETKVETMIILARATGGVIDRRDPTHQHGIAVTGVADGVVAAHASAAEGLGVGRGDAVAGGRAGNRQCVMGIGLQVAKVVVAVTTGVSRADGAGGRC